MPYSSSHINSHPREGESVELSKALRGMIACVIDLAVVNIVNQKAMMHKGSVIDELCEMMTMLMVYLLVNFVVLVS